MNLIKEKESITILVIALLIAVIVGTTWFFLSDNRTEESTRTQALTKQEWNNPKGPIRDTSLRNLGVDVLDILSADFTVQQLKRFESLNAANVGNTPYGRALSELIQSGKKISTTFSHADSANTFASDIKQLTEANKFFAGLPKNDSATIYGRILSWDKTLEEIQHADTVDGLLVVINDRIRNRSAQHYALWVIAYNRFENINKNPENFDRLSLFRTNYRRLQEDKDREERYSPPTTPPAKFHDYLCQTWEAYEALGNAPTLIIANLKSDAPLSLNEIAPEDKIEAVIPNAFKKVEVFQHAVQQAQDTESKALNDRSYASANSLKLISDKWQIVLESVPPFWRGSVREVDAENLREWISQHARSYELLQDGSWESLNALANTEHPSNPAWIQLWLGARRKHAPAEIKETDLYPFKDNSPLLDQANDWPAEERWRGIAYRFINFKSGAEKCERPSDVITYAADQQENLRQLKEDLSRKEFGNPNFSAWLERFEKLTKTSSQFEELAKKWNQNETNDPFSDKIIIEMSDTLTSLKDVSTPLLNVELRYLQDDLTSLSNFREQLRKTKSWNELSALRESIEGNPGRTETTRAIRQAEKDRLDYLLSPQTYTLRAFPDAPLKVEETGLEAVGRFLGVKNPFFQKRLVWVHLSGTLPASEEVESKRIRSSGDPAEVYSFHKAGKINSLPKAASGAVDFYLPNDLQFKWKFGDPIVFDAKYQPDEKTDVFQRVFKWEFSSPSALKDFAEGFRKVWKDDSRSGPEILGFPYPWPFWNKSDIPERNEEVTTNNVKELEDIVREASSKTP